VQHGAGAASIYTHEVCRVPCCDDAVDEYLGHLHRVRELAMLGFDGDAVALAGSLCHNGSTILAPLESCEEFAALNDEACMLLTMRETSSDIFGAMPMWDHRSFDADLTTRLNEMERVQNKLDTMADSTLQLDDVRRLLEESKAGVGDQLPIYDKSLVDAQAELHAIGETVQLMGGLIAQQRDALAAMARLTLNGTRLELE